MRGKFITFEGPEGGGKSTQIRSLSSRIKEKGHEVFYTREPGGTALGELLREVVQHDRLAEPISPQAETLLYVAARAQLVDRLIRPKLEEGMYVLADRFMDSTNAYQGYGRNLGVEKTIALNTFAVGDCIPDLTLILDLPIEIGFSRLGRRTNTDGKVAQPDRIEREERAFHERVRNGYLDLAKRYPNRMVVIDASLEPSQVESQIYKTVEERLGL